MTYLCHLIYIKTLKLLKVYKFFYKIFGIKLYLFTIFYLKLNKQSKIANQKIEKYLCIFIFYLQDNKLKKLTIAKFALNNNKSAFNELFPFFDTKNMHLSKNFNIIDYFNTNTYKKIFYKKVLDISRNIKITCKFALKILIVVQKS